jgi:signal transduction histidine kinase
MKLPAKLSLKLKIFLSVGLFYLAAVGALTFLTVRSQKNLLLSEMVERAKAGINLMELSVTGALYKLDTFRLETITREAKALPNVDYAYVFDNHGRIVGDFHPDQSRLFLPFTDARGKVVTSSGEVLVYIDERSKILDISKPVYLGHDKLGGIRLGFDLHPILGEIRAVTLRAVGVASAIFIVGLTILFIITKRMTSPIENLTQAARRIEDGDLQYRVSVHRDDEIGTLAKAFNQMTEKLMRREAELELSQSIIRRADRLSSLGMLTAGLAHEIRNPLVAIRTFTQLLPERYQDEEFRDVFKNLALKEVDRICGLVNDLLNFARPSTPNVSAQDVNEIVESIARILETEAKDKDVKILLHLASGLPKIYIDKEQIKQVCMNLILNAIQSIEGVGTVDISTGLFGENGSKRFAQIEVRDTGVGIPQKDIENIFNPFFTTKKDGSGLGLSISHQIIKEHGGYMVVESQVGHGTSFFVRLPVGYFPAKQLKAAPEVHEKDPGS